MELDPCTVGILLSSECHLKTYRKSEGLIPIKELTPEKKEILELRAGVFLTDDASLCFHHSTYYLSYCYIKHAWKCCDPFRRHKTKLVTKCLKVITYEEMKKVKKQSGRQLICGQKLCINCKIKLGPTKHIHQPHLYWKKEVDILLKGQGPSIAGLSDSHMDPTEDAPRRTKRKILRPVYCEEIEVKEKNQKRRPKRPKILRPPEKHARLQLLLASNKSKSLGSVSSSAYAILPSSVDTSEIKQKISGPEGMCVRSLKIEPVEDHEILGPQLANLLDPTIDNDNEDFSITKIKKEPLDEVPKLEPNVEMTFEFEESPVNCSKNEPLEETDNLQVKRELNHA